MRLTCCLVLGLLVGLGQELWAAPSPAVSTPSGSAAVAPLGPGKPDKPAAEPAAAPKKPPLRLDWLTDLDAALKQAAASGRMVFIYFRAEWCKPCDLMDNGTFAQQGFARYLLRNFVLVKADDTKEPSPISKKFEVRSYPSILILDGAGEPLHMVLGPRPAAVLHPILEKVIALQKAIEAQKKAPNDLEANFAAGLAFVDLDHLRKAEPYLARAAELDPKNEHGRLSAARVLLAVVPTEDGDAAQALKNLDAFMLEFKDAPEIPSAIYFKGTILLQDSRLEEARKVFDDLRQRFPTHIKAYEADKRIDEIDARLKAAPARK